MVLFGGKGEVKEVTSIAPKCCFIGTNQTSSKKKTETNDSINFMLFVENNSMVDK